MVIKGGARGGPAALAVHLERHDTNERVTVLELRGVTARDVPGALREMDCMGLGAASVRTLYHAAINTAPGERLTDEQKQRAADRLENELGFQGQPRVIIEHVKKDREHMHVVFLRIDTDRMVAIPDSHNYRKHEIVARELEREFGHQPVQGAHVDREGKGRPARTPGHDEMQQAERSGLTPQQAKEQVTKLWQQADSGRAFAASARAEGWVLAKGDKRDFVLVDSAGETHSLARRIEGAKAADVRQRMADVDPASLPTVSEAKELQGQAIAGRTKEKEKEKAPAAAPIILKVPAPIEHDPAKPLQAAARPSRPIAAADAAADAQAKAKPAERKPPPPPEPAPSKLKGIYSAAAAVTQRAYEKARGLFDKKPAPKAPEPPQRPHAPAQPTQRPFPGRVSAKQSQTHATQPTTKPKPQGAAPERKKITREELDEMIGRQRDRRRERGGPNR